MAAGGGGSIVNISSVSAIRPRGLTPYMTSKGGERADNDDGRRSRGAEFGELHFARVGVHADGRHGRHDQAQGALRAWPSRSRTARRSWVCLLASAPVLWSTTISPMRTSHTTSMGTGHYYDG